MDEAEPLSLANLPRSLRASFRHLLQRLQWLACPLAPQIAAGAGGGGGGIDMFAAGMGSLALETLQSRDDEALHASAAAAPLLLRLALVQWLLARYDPDLPRAFADLSADYAHQQAAQATLGQFKRVLRICVFLGVIPSTASSQQGLALLVGAASPASELSLLHSLVDLVCALPTDAFFASHAQYSSAQSYLVHNDPEFHKHVRLLQCVSNSAVAAGAADAGASAAPHVDSVLSDQMDLFPATLMMTANALRQVKEKQGQSKKAMPDPVALTLQMERLQQEMQTKALVLADLQKNIPLTAGENYLPSLTQLEHHLQTLVQLLVQFTSEFSSRFLPLVDAVLSHPVQVSPLGPALDQLRRDKTVLQQLLHACVHTQRNYAHILNKDIKTQMETLLQSKPDDRTTLRLTETRKVFEQSVARLEKQLAACSAAAAGAAVTGDAPPPQASPRSSRHAVAATPAPALHVGYTPAASASRSVLGASQSILTSSVDLLSPGAREREGAGSAGMFSPVKASPLPARLVTRTGGVDAVAIEARHAEEERSRREMAEREQRMELQAHQSRTPRQQTIFAEAQQQQQWTASTATSAAAASAFQRSSNAAAAPAYPSYTPHASVSHASLQRPSPSISRYAPQDYLDRDPPVSSAAGFGSSSPLLSRASQQHLQSLAQSQSRQHQSLTTDQLR